MIHVVAAVIKNGRGQFLIARRPAHVHQGGLWEFPGGKKEPTEPPENALRRELVEELGIEPMDFRPLIQIPHHYPDKSVLLDVWLVSNWSGKPYGKEGQAIQWVQAHELDDFQFPEANTGIIKAACLPALYLITPDVGNSERAFMHQLELSLQSGVSLVQFRQKQLEAGNFERLAKQVIDRCHESGAKVLLNSSPQLAKTLGADGVQLNADELKACKKRPLPKKYLVAASCHNELELFHANKLGLDFALLSPVRKTSTHPDARPLGWDRFTEWVANMSIPVYALGGVTREDVDRSWESGGQGVSAITALWGS